MAHPGKAARPKSGRPTKLTPRVAKVIVQEIRDGNYIDCAAAVAGIPRQTVFQWLRKGATEDAVEPYASFRKRVLKAQGEAERDDVGNLKGTGDWRASAWRLERRHPDRWGQRIQFILQQERERLLSIAESVLSDADFENLLVAIAGGDGAEVVEGTAGEAPAD